MLGGTYITHSLAVDVGEVDILFCLPLILPLLPIFFVDLSQILISYITVLPRRQLNVRTLQAITHQDRSTHGTL